jgi:integrase
VPRAPGRPDSTASSDGSDPLGAPWQRESQAAARHELGGESAAGDDALKAQRHLRGELVLCADDGRELTENEYKWPIWRACKRAGLRKIGWHVLRHIFASHLLMRGVPLKAVQELMGHATIEMTMRYAHLSPDVRRSAVQLLDHGNTVAIQPGPLPN